MGTIMNQIWNQQIDVALGFRTMAQRVNVMEAAGPALAAAQNWVKTKDQALEKTLFPSPAPSAYDSAG